MTRRIIGRIHLWLGLALCVPLVVIGLTGSILVFEEQLQGTAADRLATPSENRSAVEIVAAARAVAPAGFSPTVLVMPETAGAPASVRLVPPQREGPAFDAVRVTVDPVTLAATVDRQDGWLRQIFYLHSTLLLKSREGRQVVGWFGVAMLAMGISGLVNWWPRRAAWRAAFGVSRQAQGLRLQRELHGAVGVWGLLVFITVSFAGVYLAFPETVRGIVDLAFPARDLRAQMAQIRVSPIAGEKPADIDAAIALARNEIPGLRTGFVFLPPRPGRPYRVSLQRPDHERGAPPVIVIVDPWKRQIAATFDPQNFTVAERLLAWQHALHAGQALGGVWKTLVFLSGFLPLLFAATGSAIWWLKRRRRRLALRAQPVLDQADTAGRAAE